MSHRTAAWLGWGSCALTVGLLGLVMTSGPDEISALVATMVFALAFGAVGALVASRRPENPLGWLMCGSGLAYGLGGASITYVESLAPGDPELESLGGTLAIWVSTWVWMAGIGPAITFLLLLFPNGRLPSRRWRPVAWAAGAGLVMMLLGIALTEGRFDDFQVENPVGVPGAETVAGVGALVLIVAAVASIVSLVFRYRAAPREERQQLKWLTYAAALVGTALALLALIEVFGHASEELSNTLVTGSIAAIPVAMGIAILRHGLYDIDVVIRRTLVYGVLTATLAGCYLGLVLLLQLGLNPLTEQSDLAIAGSTLAVAALFRPARRRIQELVDRRFFRRKYDAALTLERFGTRLRDEVDLDALGGELRRVVGDTMQPASVSLWLRAPGAQR